MCSLIYFINSSCQLGSCAKHVFIFSPGAYTIFLPNEAENTTFEIWVPGAKVVLDR